MSFYIRKISKAHLSFTGHSLEGALAQLVAGLNGLPYPVVAFNSPGLVIWRRGGKDQRADSNINSRYGFINKIDKTVGSIDYVEVSEEEGRPNIILRGQRDRSSEKILSDIADQSSWSAEEVKAKISRDEKVKDISLLIALLPQHKIANLVEALQEKQYAALANRPYFGVRVY